MDKDYRPVRCCPWFSLLLLYLMLPAVVLAKTGAVTSTQTLEKLQQIRADINKLESKLSKDKGHVASLQNELQRAEQSIAATSTRIDQFDAQLAILATDLERVQHRLHEVAEQRQQQTHQITQQLQVQYVMGKQSPIKLLLNQEDVSHVRRLLTYLFYVNQARLQSLREYSLTLAELAKVSAEKQTMRQRTQQLLSHSAKQKNKLQQQRQARTDILRQLQKSVEHSESQLATLRQDEQRLSDLLARLDLVLADIPKNLQQGKAFKQLRGHLPWPTQGEVSHRFGSRRLGGRSQWHGIIIAAPEGQQVRTVHSGRVAYADWLRGFGLLTIIDHGEGYMTLYAHNQNLYKDIGDWVERGDVIATVGQTGGIEKPGLYFEIRHNGQPSNPQNWITNSVLASQAK